MGIIIDGKKISSEIKEQLKNRTAELAAAGKRPPCLTVIIVGDDGASKVYVANNEKTCKNAGFKSVTHRLPEQTTERELLEFIDRLDNDPETDGILIQLPLPKHINEENVLLRIDPSKDVDGFHPYNTGLLAQGRPILPPCTPSGVIELLKRQGIEIEGKHCVVIGRSNIVGKPAALLLMQENGTVTVCHSRTKNLADICRSADILVAAVGKPEFVKADMVKDGAVVIDVGVHRLNDGKLCGDVDFEGCKDKASYITPVPGGVGSMTVAMLLKNCMTAYESKN